MLKINDTTLKRVINYERVLSQRLEDANLRQWRVMTLEVMQEYQGLRVKAGEVSSALAYASYLYRVQQGLAEPAAGFFDHLCHNRLVTLLQRLEIPLEDA